MAWEWSHTNEAYEAAYHNICKKPRKWILECLREFAYHEQKEAGSNNPRFRLSFNPKMFNKQQLANILWEAVSMLHTCSNGGWDCYCCPDGCHTVPFN